MEGAEEKKYGVGGGICAMYGCNNRYVQKNARSFFTFPSDVITCRKWIYKTKRADLDAVVKRVGADQMRKTYRICDIHFKISDFKNPLNKSQGLKKGVVPSLHLPAETNKEQISKRGPRKFQTVIINKNYLSGAFPDAYLPVQSIQSLQIQLKALNRRLLAAEKTISKLKKLNSSLKQNAEFYKCLAFKNKHLVE